MMEALVEPNMGRRPLMICVFVEDITDEYILGLEVLWDYDMSVDLEHHLLRLDHVGVMVWRTGAQPKFSRISLVGNEMVPAQCGEGGDCNVRGTSGGMRPTSSSNLTRIIPEVECIIARTLVRTRPRVPVCIMNVTNQDHVLSKDTTIRQAEPDMWAAAIDDQKPHPLQNRGSANNLRK